MINKTKNKSGIIEYLPSVKQSNPRLEWLEGVDFYQHAIHRWPEIEKLLIHVPNESKSAFQYRNKLNQQGLVAGVSDYLLLMPSGKFNILAIELKRAVKSKSSVKPNQIEFIKKVNCAGGLGVICYGYEAALQAVEDYIQL